MIDIKITADGATILENGRPINLEVKQVYILTMKQIIHTILYSEAPMCFAVGFDNGIYDDKTKQQQLAERLGANNMLFIVLSTETLLTIRSHTVTEHFTISDLEKAKKFLFDTITDFLRSVRLSERGDLLPNLRIGVDAELAFIPFKI